MLNPIAPPDCIEFLSLVSEEKRGLLLTGSQPVRFAAASIPYRSDQADYAVIIQQGLVRIYIAPATGRQATVHYVHPGELLTWGIIWHPAIGVNVQAVTDTEATRLDVDHLRKLSNADPQVSLAFLTYVIGLEANAVRIIAVRTLGDITARLAFDLLDRACTRQVDSGHLEMRVTQQDLADSIGSVREVVARAMRRLRTDGILESSRSSIRVLDVRRLEDIVARAIV